MSMTVTNTQCDAINDLCSQLTEYIGDGGAHGNDVALAALTRAFVESFCNHQHGQQNFKPIVVAAEVEALILRRTLEAS